jgi:hypothetical protein
MGYIQGRLTYGMAQVKSFYIATKELFAITRGEVRRSTRLKGGRAESA